MVGSRRPPRASEPGGGRHGSRHTLCVPRRTPPRHSRTPQEVGTGRGSPALEVRKVVLVVVERCEVPVVHAPFKPVFTSVDRPRRGRRESTETEGGKDDRTFLSFPVTPRTLPRGPKPRTTRGRAYCVSSTVVEGGGVRVGPPPPLTTGVLLDGESVLGRGGHGSEGRTDAPRSQSGLEVVGPTLPYLVPRSVHPSRPGVLGLFPKNPGQVEGFRGATPDSYTYPDRGL